MNLTFSRVLYRKFNIKTKISFMHCLKGLLVWASHLKRWRCVHLYYQFCWCLEFFLSDSLRTLLSWLTVLIQKVSWLWDVPRWSRTDWICEEESNRICRESKQLNMAWYKFTSALVLNSTTYSHSGYPKTNRVFFIRHDNKVEWF